VPDSVVVDVEARVVELVEARRPELEQLVRQAVDAELERLVDVELDRALERLASSSNGATPMRSTSEPRTLIEPNESEARTRSEPCASCGERPAVPGRTICNRCRGRRRRERRALAAQDAGDGPRSGPITPSEQ
jgi:hypothetical protein